MPIDSKITSETGSQAFGARPPAHAPQQVTTPGSEAPTAEQIVRARSNEQELPAFAPQPMTDEQVFALLGKTPDQIRSEIEAKSSPGGLVDSTGRPITGGVPAGGDGIPTPTTPPPAVTSSLKPPDIPRRLRRRPGMAIVVPTADVAPVAPIVTDPIQITPPAAFERGPDEEALPAAVPVVEQEPPAPLPVVDVPAAPVEPYRPAASDTDSPSRGLPTHTTDPGKRITGGFGDAVEAQYVPLDGTELRTLVCALMDTIYDRLQDDLRFSIAATYPRVNARVVVEVECLAYDQSFQIVQVMPPHTKTPLAVAREYGDQVVFVVVAERQESTPAGESVVPPNQTRIELGLQVPRKQAVQTPGGRQIVDVVS